MGIPTVYHSSDAGAPVLSGAAGSLVAVLKACLVDGYGAKAGAGWSMPFVDGMAQNAVFRNVESRALRVQDDGLAPNPDSRWARVTGAAVAAGLDTLTDPFPGATVDAGWLKSDAADADSKEWFVIADDKRFYFFPHTQTGAAGTGDDVGNEFKVWFFGRFSSFMPGDPGPYMMSSYWQNAGGSFPTGSTTAVMPRRPRKTLRKNVSLTFGVKGGLLQSVDATVAVDWAWVSFWGYAEDSDSEFGKRAESPYPSPVTGDALISPVFIEDIKAFAVRGQMPGLIDPLHYATRQNNQLPLSFAPAVSTIDAPWGQGVSALLIPFTYWGNLASGDTASGSLLLDISSDWDLI